MPPWFLVWIGRWLSGERFRKATSQDYRLHFAGLFFSGIWMIVVTAFGQRFLSHAGAVSIWIAAVVAMTVLFLGTFALARVLPAAVSLVLGIIVWAVFALLVLHMQGVFMIFRPAPIHPMQPTRATARVADLYRYAEETIE